MDTKHLAQLLAQLHEETDEQLRLKYQRSLPFQDGLFDRWTRANRLGFAEGTSIYDSALVFGDVTVGEHTWIGPYVLLDGGSDHLRIGAYCQLSAGVHVYTHHTVRWALSRGLIPKQSGPVTIGDCVYIGSQSIITYGVTIGDQSVIAANSYVNRDVPARTIVAGNPARKVGTVVGQGTDIRLDFPSRNKTQP